MRINKFVAQATGLSRRAADKAIEQGRVAINNRQAQLGDAVGPQDVVLFDNKALAQPATTVTIMLNKPAGYVCSREGQGNKTIYDLLPAQYHQLKPVGRLDKDSSGLLLLTNDGQLAYELTHPKFAKTKIYEVTIDKPLTPEHLKSIQKGVTLDDGLSKLNLEPLDKSGLKWQVTMSEGRNRQIRRTFAALGYTVISLRRIKFGPYSLDKLPDSQLKLA